MGGIGYYTSTGAIDQHIDLLQDCLPDQYLIPQYQSFLYGIPPRHTDHHWPGYSNHLFTTVCIFSYPLSPQA